jgi:mannosyltransferase OCH1-like enzyme/predicted Zn-dependent protease
MIEEEIKQFISQALAARNLGKRAEALTYFERAFALDPLQQALAANIATELRELGRFEEATIVLQTLLNRIPNSMHALDGLAQIARKQGKRVEAIAYFEKTLALQPLHPTYPVAIAVELRELGRFEEAISLLDKHSAQLDSALLWHHKGLICLAQANHEEAMRCYQSGILASPTDPRCYEAMASELIKFGLHQRALEVIELAEQSVTSSNFLYLYKIRTLISQGLYEAAIKACQLDLESRPENLTTLRHLIELEMRIGNFNQAEDLLNKTSASTLDEQQYLLRQRSELARARFDLPLARRLAQEGLNLNPSSKPYQSYAALVDLMMGNIEFARQELANLQAEVPKNAYRKIWPSALGNIQGRLYSEMRTNPFAQRLLSEAWQVAGDRERIQAMASALKSEPSYIGTAMSLLSELRRQGAFLSNASNQLSTESSFVVLKIPKTIIQFWHEAIPPEDIDQIMQSWDRENPDFEYLVFDDVRAETFIMNSCDPKVLRAFRIANYPAMRADVFRLAYLAIHGGVYADADDLCRHPIGDWFTADRELFLIQEHLGSIGNNFMAAIPHHPFVLAALDKVVDQILSKQGDIWFTSGPGALTILFCNYYLNELKEFQIPPQIGVMDCYAMARKLSIQLPRQYKQTSQSWSSPKNEQKPIYRIANSFIRNAS